MKLWKRSRRLAAIVCLLACGCSVNREIPRGEYAAAPERKHEIVPFEAILAQERYRFL